MLDHIPVVSGTNLLASINAYLDMLSLITIIAVPLSIDITPNGQLLDRIVREVRSVVQELLEVL